MFLEFLVAFWWGHWVAYKCKTLWGALLLGSCPFLLYYLYQALGISG